VFHTKNLEGLSSPVPTMATGLV